MESFWANLKKELVYQEWFKTIESAKASLFESIEVFNLRQRRHSGLGFCGRAEFEPINHPELHVRLSLGISGEY